MYGQETERFQEVQGKLVEVTPKPRQCEKSSCQGCEGKELDAKKEECCGRTHNDDKKTPCGFNEMKLCLPNTMILDKGANQCGDTDTPQTSPDEEGDAEEPAEAGDGEEPAKADDADSGDSSGGSGDEEGATAEAPGGSCASCEDCCDEKDGLLDVAQSRE